MACGGTKLGFNLTMVLPEGGKICQIVKLSIVVASGGLWWHKIGLPH